MNSLLADAILLIHFAFALFVVGGLLLTWLGAWSGWRWEEQRYKTCYLLAFHAG